MGVYISGMDMPKSCFAGNGCEFRHICEPYKVALVRPALMSDGEWIETAKKIAGEMCKKRLDACPLVGVSTPHGRLIDADALKDSFVASFKACRKWAKESDGSELMNARISQATITFTEALLRTKGQPTVIEAEE